MGERTTLVLLVEDDADLADVTAEYLERNYERFDVVTAGSVAEARDELDSVAVDCVVSDYGLPDENGLDFLEALRETHPDLPFILYTGKGSESVASRAIRADATDYIRKGTSTESLELLANRVSNAVEHARAQRRATEQERISTVIREVNQALVRSTTTEEIERRVCEVVSDSEPYLFAWVGDYDADSGEVVPRASAGVEEGYLDEVTITVDEQPTGQGPTGTAIRTRSIQVMQNILENADYEPWRSEARARGYQASAAIPLAYENTVFGVLNVYADRPYAFDETEREVLSDLGDDVAHAMHAVRTRERLGETTERLQTMIDASPNAIVTLDADQRVTLWNEAAEDLFGWSSEEVLGEPNPVVPEDRADEFEELFSDQVLQGERFSGIETQRRTKDGYLLDVSLSASALQDPSGDVVGAMAIFEDITDRKEKERALQAEQRFTERMLETLPDVFFALDVADWQFLRWNDQLPAVTGYTDEELAEVQPAALVADDDADRIRDAINHVVAEGTKASAELGLATKSGRTLPYEFTATILDDDEEGPTVLATGRDVSEHVQYERTLKSLNEATRRLQRADASDDVAETIVDIAVEILDLSVVGVYLFDEDDGALDAVAHSAEAERLVGALPELHPGEGPGWTAFASNERTVIEADDEEGVLAPGTPISSECLVPIEGFGVLVAGDLARDTFDERTVELAEILAGAATETLERTKRETHLRERERTIDQQASELSKLTRINRQIRSVIRAVVQANSREEIERAVCDRLIESDEFELVTILRTDAGGDALTPAARAGTEQGYLDAVSLETDGDTSTCPPEVRAARARVPTIVENTAERVQAEPWRREALVRNLRSAIAIPLVFDEMLYGVLSIYASQSAAFDDVSRDVLVELGGTIGHATSSLERRKTLMSERVIEVQFAIRDPECPYLSLARTIDGSFTVDSLIPTAENVTTAFLTLSDSEPEQLLAADLPFVIDAEHVGAATGEPTVRVDVAASPLTDAIVTSGVRFVDMEVTTDRLTLTVELPSGGNVRDLANRIREPYPDAELVSRTQTDEPDPATTLQTTYADALTDRQREVLETAYHSGFFEWPRDVSGEDLAEMLDIAPATLHNHLRTAERKVFGVLH